VDHPATWSFSRAIADPQHEQHAEIREWCGDDFDPNALDTEARATALAALAKQWARKPAVKRKKTTDTRS
jgi:hypothetical protein